VPLLRFSRDRRGNEITSLLHGFRRHGKGKARLLYWYRTPPNVRVGRSALDEAAIRQLEEGHPDLVFDWPRILQARSSPAAAEPSRPPGGAADEGRRRMVRKAARTAGAAPPPAEPETPIPPAREPEPPVQHPTASEATIGLISHDDVARLRGRYAELLARIAERVPDPVRADMLRAEAGALNPDAWVTPDEVRRGLKDLEPNEQRFRELLGRRRRSRRGGARRRRKKAVAPQAENAGAPCTRPGDSSPRTNE